MRILLQVVQATTAMYNCSSVVTWNPIAYIPVVNQAGMVASVQEVAGQLSAIKHTELLDRPTFVAEDVAFFNGRLQASLQTPVLRAMMLNRVTPSCIMQCCWHLH